MVVAYVLKYPFTPYVISWELRHDLINHGFEGRFLTSSHGLSSNTMMWAPFFHC
jgi:hypothetical protein